VLNYINNKSN